MTEQRSPEESTISLKAHQRILFEIRMKVAAANLDLGALSDIEATGEELDAIVEWIDSLGAKA